MFGVADELDHGLGSCLFTSCVPWSTCEEFRASEGFAVDGQAAGWRFDLPPSF